jgi:hypothetical protein
MLFLLISDNFRKLTGRVVTLEEGTPAESPIQEWGIAERDNKEETPARKREFRKRQAQKEDQIERPNTLSDIRLLFHRPSILARLLIF